MSQWNWADIWEQAAESRPASTALVHGKRRTTWAEFDRRADGVAQALLDLEPSRQDKVAQYLYNGPEYVEALYGTVKAGLVPVNTNYRYEADELVYLWDNADAVAVFFDAAFTDKVDAVRAKLPEVRGWFRVGGHADELGHPDRGAGGVEDSWSRVEKDAAVFEWLDQDSLNLLGGQLGNGCGAGRHWSLQ